MPLDVAERLIISIHPEDLEKGDIDLDQIDEFLRYSCRHYRKVTFHAKPEGKEISGSVIANLDN